MALIERSEKDKEQHELELRDLQRMIHHDNRIREFMGIKASNRTELKAEEAAKKQKTGTPHALLLIANEFIRLTSNIPFEVSPRKMMIRKC